MITSPPWSPPLGPGVAPVEVGGAWDAVRVAGPVGETVLDSLGDFSGSVVAGPCSRCLYWLLPREAAREWRMPHVEVLPRTDQEIAYVGMPSADLVAGPGVHWRIPWRPGAYLTDPDRLHAALSAAVAAPEPPVPVARQ